MNQDSSREPVGGEAGLVGGTGGDWNGPHSGRGSLQGNLDKGHGWSPPPWNVGAALQTDHPACNRNVQGEEGAGTGLPARWRRRGEVECAAASGLEALLCNMVDTVKAAVEEISADLEDGTAAAPGGGPLCASRR
jgi:hypothetical protein